MAPMCRWRSRPQHQTQTCRGQRRSKPYSKVNVQAELSLYQGFVFLVARSPEINYLLICLARSPVEKRQRIWADRIPQLPTVAFDDLTNLISDNVRRCRLRQ